MEFRNPRQLGMTYCRKAIIEGWGLKMKVDIYQLKGDFQCLIVANGVDIEEVLSHCGIGRMPNLLSSNIEIPNQAGGLVGIDGITVNREINEQGWSLQTMNLGRY